MRHPGAPARADGHHADHVRRPAPLARPRAAELLVAFGGAAAGNASAYDEVRRTVLLWRDAMSSRALVDQAKGILVHALGCTADQALDRAVSGRTAVSGTGR
ncbi:MAG: ANTAR domain-containing protein [Streptosporangiales bacterium]